MERVGLLRFFDSWSSSERELKAFIEPLYGVDPVIGLLALEGLFRIEGDVQRGQLACGVTGVESIKIILREWRCRSPLGGAYSGILKAVPEILQSLTIFKAFEVPLFIDNYGSKKLLSSYGETENIHIDGDTPIFHVTHRDEADGIVNDKHFKASSAKNIVEGIWFGLGNSESVYGTQAFKTTLYKLGVTGLHQGEIVAYKNEVNVILYAADDTDFAGVRKPTNEAARWNMKTAQAYVKVSVFVPLRFLPARDKFWKVISGPAKVYHGPICVRAKRSHTECKELSNVLVDDMQGMHL